MPRIDTDRDTPIKTVKVDIKGYGRISGHFSYFKTFPTCSAPSGVRNILSGERLTLKEGETAIIFTSGFKENVDVNFMPRIDTLASPTINRKKELIRSGVKIELVDIIYQKELNNYYRNKEERTNLTIQADEETTIYGPAMIAMGPVIQYKIFQNVINNLRNPLFRYGEFLTITTTFLIFLLVLIFLISILGSPKWVVFPFIIAFSFLLKFLIYTVRRLRFSYFKKTVRTLRGFGRIPRIMTGNTGVYSANFLPPKYRQLSVEKTSKTLIENKKDNSTSQLGFFMFSGEKANK